MTDLIYNSNNILDIVFQGVQDVYYVIKETYGPLGHNVLIQLPKKILLVDDGATVVNNIKTKDNNKNIGISICQSISNYIYDKCGDGTTTCVILFYYLLKHSIELIKNGASIFDLVNKYKSNLKLLLEKIDDLKLNIHTNELDMVLRSTCMDEAIINNVKKAYELAKTDGLILLKKSNKGEYLKHTKGYFLNIHNTYDLIELKNIKVILYNNILYDYDFLLNLKNEKYLLLCSNVKENICDYFKNSNIFIIPIKEKDIEVIFKDLELLLDTKCCSKTINISKEVDVTIDKNKLIFHNLESSDLIMKIKKEIDSTNSLFEKEKLKERLAKLTNGIVSIYVNGTTEEEIQYRVLKYEDAIRTSYNALQFGICKGAGYIYHLLIKVLDEVYDKPLINSLKSLIISLISNTNSNSEYIYNHLNDNTWYDLINNDFIDINNLQVYDSIYNVKQILLTVINNICLIINTKSIVFNEELNKEIVEEFI